MEDDQPEFRDGKGNDQDCDEQKPGFPGSRPLQDLSNFLSQDENKDSDGYNSEGGTSHGGRSSQESKGKGRDPDRTSETAESNGGSGLSGKTKQGTPSNPPSHASTSREPIIPQPEGIPPHDHLGHIQSGIVPVSAVDPSAGASSSSNPQPPLTPTGQDGNNKMSRLGLEFEQNIPQPRTPVDPNEEVITTGSSRGQRSVNAGGRPVQGDKATTNGSQVSKPETVDNEGPFQGVIQRLRTISKSNKDWSLVCTAVNVQVRLTSDDTPVGTPGDENLSWYDLRAEIEENKLLEKYGLMRLEDLALSNREPEHVLEMVDIELARVLGDDEKSRSLVVICLPGKSYLPLVDNLHGYTMVLNCNNLDVAKKAFNMDTQTPIHVKLNYTKKITEEEGNDILALKAFANFLQREVFIEPLDDENQIKWCIRANFHGIVTKRRHDLDTWYKGFRVKKLGWTTQPETTLIKRYSGNFGFET
ncbi:hypothetical protein BDV06DRAFT_218719 [Aspergillus oleicola]